MSTQLTVLRIFHIFSYFYFTASRLLFKKKTKKKQGDTCTKKSTDFLFVCVQKMKFLEDLMRTNEKHY